MSAPKTPGPKPRAGTTATNVVKLRATDDEIARWQKLADKQGISLSQLVRESLDLAIARGASR